MGTVSRINGKSARAASHLLKDIKGVVAGVSGSRKRKTSTLRKRTSERAPRRPSGGRARPAVKSKQADVEMLEATGVTVGKLTYMHKKPRISKLLKALSKPIIKQSVSANLLNSWSSACRYETESRFENAEVREMIREAITQTNAGGPALAQNLLNTQVWIKSISVHRVITNPCNFPVKLKAYEMICKKNCPTISAAGPVALAKAQSIEEGQSAAQDYSNGNGIFLFGTDLLGYNLVKKYWTLTGFKTYYLKAGETVELTSTAHINRMVNDIQLEALSDTCVAGLTACTVFQLEGASTIEFVEEGEIGLSRAQVLWTNKRHSVSVPYPLPSAHVNRFDDISFLVVENADSDEKVMNVDTAVAVVDAIAAF